MKHAPLVCFVGLMLAAGCLRAADFTAVNRALRDGAIRSGDACFDPAANLVRRSNKPSDRLDVCQGSLEYAAALFSAGEKLDRANAIVAAVLKHQDRDADSPTFGNFHWWGDETRVTDRNAVCFMSPWLARIALEHGRKLTPDNAAWLPESLRLCIQAVRAHDSGPDYSNIWLLKAASLVVLGRALEEPSLETDGANRIQRWVDLTAKQGVGEYNSPCYSAVNVYALEWIYHYATSDALRRQVSASLDYLYTDIFEHWHWEAAIGAGTHSRAYPDDRATGLSLVSCLVFKQCGQPLRMPSLPFLYVFAVNDYPVPASICATARKEGMLPFSLRTTILDAEGRVETSLYMTKDFSLATQTGRRPLYEDRPIWDIPFKVTYAGSRTERRASFIIPQPTTKQVTVAAVQEGPLALVLYEADLKDSDQHVARLRLDIEPAAGGMCDEILVADRLYDRKPTVIEPGTVIGWRVAETLVAVRVLRSRGWRTGQPGPVDYRLGPQPEGGLCLDCPLTDEPSAAVPFNDLNAGFAIACSTRAEHSSLADFLRTFRDWSLTEQAGPGTREIHWRAGSTHLALQWDAARNRVLSQTVNGRPVAVALPGSEGQSPARGS